MNFYTIHCKNPADPNPIIIKEGFNWYHLFFNVFWSIYNRTWDLTLIYIAFYCLLAFLGYLGCIPAILNVITIAFYVALSFYANDFYRRTLKRRGYVLSNLIAAHSTNEALYIFLKNLSKQN